MKKAIVTGSIEIPKEIWNKKFHSIIRILDTSFEDAPAVTIAETRIDYLPIKPGGKNTLPFELSIDTEIIPSHDYTVSVLIDLDGDGIISKNDYIQKQSYHAILQGKTKEGILIELQKV